MMPPCVKTCPDRSPTCHTTCRKYKAYAEEMRQAREARRADMEGLNAYCEGAKRKCKYAPQF